MIRNYIKTALRNLRRTRGYSALNVLGLTVGITAASLIFLWVEDEVSYDEFPNKETSYIIKSKQTFDGISNVFDGVPGLLGPAIKEEIPGVKYAARVTWKQSSLFNVGDHGIYQSGYYVEPDFMNIFALQFVEGDRTTAMNSQNWHIVGVVKDVIMGSPFEQIRPTVMYGASSWFSVMHIKFNADLPTQAALDKTRQILKEYNPNEPFNYIFIDQEYAAKFKDTQRLGNIAGIFTFLTIFISCLGLFGLAAYMAENRIKEIGVRKVLGASVLSLVNLLNKEFLTLVGIACFLAIPIAYWVMDSWLNKFTYHTDIHWWVFAFIGFGALFIALLTVSWQAMRAALTNPVDSLRDE